MRRSIMAATVGVSMACGSLHADVKLASVFTDHMVLQRDKAVNVWGTAMPGKRVTVSVNGHEAAGETDGRGNWSVKLPESKASATPVEMVVREEGGNTITVRDVLFGDVWLCSGQSNMGFQLWQSSGGTEAVAAATDDKVRLLVVPKVVSDKPLNQQHATWSVCSPQTAKAFSAVAYYFGNEIRTREDVPVGLIGTYWGGTPAESWTPKDRLSDPQWEPLWDRDRQLLADFPKQLEAWEERVKGLAPTVPKPDKPLGPNDPHRPSVLWNAMVQPLVPTSIKGVIWYQGESNTRRSEQYRTLFPTMITAWRDAFGQGDVPFLFVQLANYVSEYDTPAGSAWAELREAQSMTLKLPNTAMAVAIDIGHPTDIHPTDKRTVGVRLALAAEHVAYGRNLVYSGPVFQAMEVDGARVKVWFDHVGGGLTTRGGGDSVTGFAVAGEDQKFVPADARIDGDAVVLTAKGVDNPAAVRYGWASNPTIDLYNKEGLPAVPFRTDNWAMVTAGKR